jgi:hypothetical protein
MRCSLKKIVASPAKTSTDHKPAPGDEPPPESNLGAPSLRPLQGWDSTTASLLLLNKLRANQDLLNQTQRAPSPR